MLNKPIIQKELIEHLEKLFPVRSPGLDDSLQLIYFMSGRCDVVRYLRQLYDEQNKED